MTLIKLLTAPIRRLVNHPLFHLVAVVVIILLLPDDDSILGHFYNGLDKLVAVTMDAVQSVVRFKSFTKSLLLDGLMILYVYIVYLVCLWLARRLIRGCVDLAGRHNILWLRNTIAHERGIAAYRAWEPFENIRPPEIPQFVWEERFAWPANDAPPYPSLWRRAAFAVASYVLVIAVILALLQLFTPIAALSWTWAGATSVFWSIFGSAGH
jgi:hypothetical protein